MPAHASTIRPPAVAGTFYPASAAELGAMVGGFLRQAEAAMERDPERPPKAIIAPHAGYIYSGPTAGFAFAAAAPAAAGLRRAVVLGPAHRVAVRGLALSGHAAFATPLGEVEVDAELAELAAALPQVVEDPRPHALEHSLEVELPFLQVLAEGLTLLPLVVGDASGEEVAQVLERVWGGPETLVVISSDLSHYLPYDAARRVDGETAGAIARLEGPIDPRRACGAIPINGLLLAARRRGMRVDLLDLRNSGDTAGDRFQVVGYGAFAFHEN